MKAMSDTQTPQGVLAVVKRPSYDLEDILARRPAHLLLVEGIQDPGNLGTMFRTGEGAGVTGVIMHKTTVDLFSSQDRALDHGKPLPGAFLCGRRLGKKTCIGSRRQAYLYMQRICKESKCMICLTIGLIADS